MGRKSLSKRTRFEIFKRDRFQCVHCGATPNEGPLHVDHMVAVANGGSDDPTNLVTSCADCNLGKAAVPLEAVKLRKGKATQADLEHAEQLRDWLAIQQEVSSAKGDVREMLETEWEKRVGSRPFGIGSRLEVALREFGMERLGEAMGIVGHRKSGYSETTQLKYFYGILRRWREDATGQRSRPVAQPPEAPPSKYCALARTAVREAISDINRHPENFPDFPSMTRHVARAVYAVTGEPFLDDDWSDRWSDLRVQMDRGVRTGGLFLRAIDADGGKSIQWIVEDVEGFSVWRDAFYDLMSELNASIDPSPDKPRNEWINPDAVWRAYGAAGRLEHWALTYEREERK